MTAATTSVPFRIDSKRKECGLVNRSPCSRIRALPCTTRFSAPSMITPGNVRTITTLPRSTTRGTAISRHQYLRRSRIWNAHSDDRRHGRRGLDLHTRTGQRFAAQGTPGDARQFGQAALQKPNQLDGWFAQPRLPAYAFCPRMDAGFRGRHKDVLEVSGRPGG